MRPWEVFSLVFQSEFFVKRENPPDRNEKPPIVTCSRRRRPIYCCCSRRWRWSWAYCPPPRWAIRSCRSGMETRPVCRRASAPPDSGSGRRSGPRDDGRWARPATVSVWRPRPCWRPRRSWWWIGRRPRRPSPNHLRPLCCFLWMRASNFRWRSTMSRKSGSCWWSRSSPRCLPSSAGSATTD